MESIFQVKGGGGGGGGHSSGGHSTSSHTSTHTTTTIVRTVPGRPVGGRTVIMPIIVPGGHGTAYMEQPASNYPVEQVPAPVAFGFVVAIFFGVLLVLALAIADSQ